ncbi:hypothetical protein [Lapidilactobacillus gannanensis]|jgi:uncharacterized membrane protein|uniref:Uncharacterized protein n=1 Tax=Lapidilactobacillus gannanensis TaxID=2486002 RepID=A0ABW4BJL8_9LACO|nr:hypothetical protein [Lapidilactobacillus gannanensis]MCH4057561.1 hypothetical protein [Lactobacillaceae bacterium]
MNNPKWLNILLVIVYALVVVLLIVHQSMASMYLMGFGMLGEAVYGLITSSNKH